MSSDKSADCVFEERQGGSVTRARRGGSDRPRVAWEATVKTSTLLCDRRWLSLEQRSILFETSC